MLHSVSQPEFHGISALIKPDLQQIAQEYRDHTHRISQITRQLTDIARHNPLCQLLLSIPGIGPINATAIYSAIGNGSQFNNSREFAVWLGLTPKQFASGESFKSAGITKRGNRYLRKQLVHGARVLLLCGKNKTSALSQWGNQLVARRGFNKACVAMAARLARLSWVLLQRNEMYQAT